jgi:P-type E1-E2 ATPase
VDRVYMLTGDNEYVAKKVATQSGIEDFKANLLPEDKLEFIKSHLNPEYKLAMVGDGVNDAASLTQADIGIAMGAIGSDIAIESADIALMNDDFSKIKEIISIGTHTINVAKQNFVIWGAINVIGLALVFTHVIGPSGAAAFNFVTDFFPLLNSLRILGYKFLPEAKL